MFLLWAGAAISISEIYTGGLIAPLGFTKGFLAIVLGHIIGTTFLALGGYISFTDKKNAMDKVKDSLGVYGAKIVAFLNVLQLLGWSAIMIIQSGRALNGLMSTPKWFGIAATALVVFLWSYFFNNYSKKVNDISVVLLIILCFGLFFSFNMSKHISSQQPITFVTALELAVSMPVSWLPLIGDYTKDGESGKGVFLSSFIGYFLGSCLMYILGLSISLYSGKDVIEFLAGSSIKLVAVFIILFSTVTTTFLDIYSAVISSKQLFKIEKENFYVFLYSLLAMLLAFVFPIENYQNFLLTIGSVFVPVYTVVFAEHFLKSSSNFSKINTPGIVCAVIGVLLYNYFTQISFGSPTILSLIIVALLYLSTIKIFSLGGVKND
jgi:putative hydroxymethylpyrimidine transporter CytX